MGPLALASEKMSPGHLLPAFWQAPGLLKIWQPPFRFPLFRLVQKNIAFAMFLFGAGSGATRTRVGKDVPRTSFACILAGSRPAQNLATSFSIPTVQTCTKNIAFAMFLFGAGSGNRTHVISLEG